MGDFWVVVVSALVFIGSIWAVSEWNAKEKKQPGKIQSANSNGEIADYQKKKARENDRLEKGILCFFTAVVVYMACFFMMQAPQSAKIDEAYNSGYEAGRDEGYSSGYAAGKEANASEQFNDGYNSGYERGYSDGQSDITSTNNYDTGYNAGYYNGYKDGIKAKESGSTTVKSGGGSDSQAASSAPGTQPEQPVGQVVYITDTGSKYHNWGCQYLSQSCYEISLDDAIAQGYTACSRCW